MKYINLEYAGYIIFDKTQKHSDMAKKFPNDNVLSAGFIEVAAEEDCIACYGESTSLKKESKPDDSKYLERRLSIYS